MENTKNTCYHCAFKSSAVATLNQEELNFLGKGCWQTQFKKGELILKEGAPANYIAFIREGFVKLVKKGIGGKDFILSISPKGSYLGIQILNQKSKTYYFSAAAIAPTEICFIDIEKFRELLLLNGTFATEVISTIIDDEMNYFDRLVNNVQQQLPGRLANTLLYFKNQVYHEDSFNLNLTKSELASLIGTSRESVSRLMKEFQDAGIISAEKNWIHILNEEKLEQIKMKG
ncbi:MAG TPA: Crp/Fnr family transcriptional regulator [Prolixibacteraceae bacterium]|nr:Crp/Fnr family transcriptional regulator [Prolixibacteraceae bacterium]